MNITMGHIKGPQGFPVIPAVYNIGGNNVKVADVVTGKVKVPGVEIITKVVQVGPNVNIPILYVADKIPLMMLSSKNEEIVNQQVVQIYLPELIAIGNANKLPVINLQQFQADMGAAVEIVKGVGGPTAAASKIFKIQPTQQQPQTPTTTPQKPQTQQPQTRQNIQQQPQTQQSTQRSLEAKAEIEALRKELETVKAELKRVEDLSSVVVREKTKLERENMELVNENKTLKQDVLKLKNDAQKLTKELNELKPQEPWKEEDIVLEEPPAITEEPNPEPKPIIEPVIEPVVKPVVEPKPEPIIEPIVEPTYDLPPEPAIVEEPQVSEEPVAEEEAPSVGLAWGDSKPPSPVEPKMEAAVEIAPAPVQPAPVQPAPVQPTQTTNTIADILGIEGGNPWDIVDVVDSVVGFRDAKHATEAIEDWVRGGEYTEPANRQLGETLASFLQLPNHPKYNVQYIMSRFLTAYGDLSIVYEMTRIRIKGEHIKVGETGSKLYFGLPYVHFLFSLAIERVLNLDPKSKEYYERMLWMVRNVASSKILTTDGEETETEEDDDDSESKGVDVDMSEKMAADAKNGVSYFIQHLLTELNGVKYKCATLYGVDSIRYVFVVSEESKPVISVESAFLKQIKVNLVNFAITPNGLIVTDKLFRDLSVDVLGFLFVRHFYTPEGSVFPGTYDEYLNQFKRDLEINKRLNVSRYNPVGSAESIRFKFIKAVRLHSTLVAKGEDGKPKQTPIAIQPMYLLGEDISPTATTNRKYVLLPRVGDYLETVGTYIDFVEPIEITKGATATSITRDSFNALVKDINSDLISVPIDLAKKISTKDFAFTEDLMKQLAVSYRGLYMPEPVKEAIPTIDEIIIKNFVLKVKEMKAQ